MSPTEPDECLIERFLSETLTDAQEQTLLERLHANPELSRRLAEHLYVDMSIRRLALLGSVTEMSEDGTPESTGVKPSSSHGIMKAVIPARSTGMDAFRRNPRLIATSCVVSLFAVVCVAVQFTFTRPDPAGMPPPDPLGRITAVAYPSYTDNARSLRTGQFVDKETVHLSSGLLEFRLQNGVRVVMDGETSLDLLSASRIFCHNGRISVEVPKGAEGFEVHTQDERAYLGNANNLHRVALFQIFVRLSFLKFFKWEVLMSGAFSQKELNGLIDAFNAIPEYRKNILNTHHKLVDIIVIAVCGVIAGADGPASICDWAKIHRESLTRILNLENGVPSRDTIRRTLQAIQPEVFQQCFLDWIDAKRENNTSRKEHIAIDGKTLRRSHDKKNHLGALHIVSAWSSEQGISLGQLATEEKSNEITAIPQLLDSLNVEGSVISIDAMGTQVKIAEKIIEKKAGYVLAVKDNQAKLHRAIIEHFDAIDPASKNVSHVVEEETSHGRVERREYFQVTLPEDFGEAKRWPGVKTIGMVTRTHRKTNEEEETTETRYYISSERRNGPEFSRYVRKHWGIENSLHWVLDMTFREDESRIRDRTVADNLSWIRRLTITLLKQHPAKTSLVGKRRAAAWSFDFLLELIRGKQMTP